jgi:hypothetical protein
MIYRFKTHTFMFYVGHEILLLLLLVLDGWKPDLVIKSENIKMIKGEIWSFSMNNFQQNLYSYM